MDQLGLISISFEAKSFSHSRLDVALGLLGHLDDFLGVLQDIGAKSSHWKE